MMVEHNLFVHNVKISYSEPWIFSSLSILAIICNVLYGILHFYVKVLIIKMASVTAHQKSEEPTDVGIKVYRRFETSLQKTLIYLWKTETFGCQYKTYWCISQTQTYLALRTTCCISVNCDTKELLIHLNLKALQWSWKLQLHSLKYWIYSKSKPCLKLFVISDDFNLTSFWKVTHRY